MICIYGFDGTARTTQKKSDPFEVTPIMKTNGKD